MHHRSVDKIASQHSRLRRQLADNPPRRIDNRATGPGGTNQVPRSGLNGTIPAGKDLTVNHLTVVVPSSVVNKMNDRFHILLISILRQPEKKSLVADGNGNPLLLIASIPK